MPKTDISWTQQTWNPIVGCSKVSKGCQNCYAETIANRMVKGLAKGKTAEKYKGTISENGHWSGQLNFDEKTLLLPLKIKKPTMFFVNSMSDLFHENVPFEWIYKIFAVMALCPQHTFQVLTKRSERMVEYFDYISNTEIANVSCEIIFKNNLKNNLKNNPFDIFDKQNYQLPLPNVWLGVSVENNKNLHRVYDLFEVPAKVRFVSAEPLLENINFVEHQDEEDEFDVSSNLLAGTWTGNDEGLIAKLDWVIVGGESGFGARPCEISWVENIVTQCQTNEVPVFVKQLGTVLGKKLGIDHKEMSQFPKSLQVQEFPKTDKQM